MKYLYISILFFFISLVFLLIQGIYNNKFYRFKDREIIVERTLFEQFAYEVYSSIDNLLPFIYDINENCVNKFELNLNLDTYFDCKGIYDKDLHPSCQDAIVRNYTLCRSKGLIDLDLDNLGNILDYDERTLLKCRYYSKYTRKITEILKNNLICLNYNNDYNYEYLLANSVSQYNYDGSLNFCGYGFKKCGILDTKNNLLCLPENQDCPINYINISEVQYDISIKKNDTNYMNFQRNNSLPIIISMIISENQPLNHEWDRIVIESVKKISDEDSNKRRELSVKDFMLIDTDNDNTYNKVSLSEYFNLQVKDIGDHHTIIGIHSNKYRENQALNIYTRNYIGFKNVDELNKFKKKFNNQDYTDNPLYKLSNSGHNPLVTIIFSAVFIAITIAYFILLFFKIFQQEIYKILFFIFGAIVLIFWLADLIIIAVHFVKYRPINIDMDDRMKKVLDRYNRRSLLCQLYRIIALALNTFSTLFIFLSLFKGNNKLHLQ